MNYQIASSTKAQMKIQQMAFVLVALMIFFGMVALIYFSVQMRSLRGDVKSLQEEEAKELVRKLASTPEFSWSSQNCPYCVDFDKAMVLSSRASYKGFWNLNYLKIEKVYPALQGECDRANYPDCSTITLINKENPGSPFTSYIALCHWEQEKGGYTKCELGKIHASGKDFE